MPVFYHLGRIVLASLFILGGIDKIANPEGTIETMAAAGLPLPSVLIFAVIALELGGGLAVAAGIGRAAQIAALALIAHTLAINIVLHPFWSMPPDLARIELSLFFKNVAVMGGLLMVAAQRPSAQPN